MLISTHRDFANFCLTSEVGKALRLWLQVLVYFKIEMKSSFNHSRKKLVCFNIWSELRCIEMQGCARCGGAFLVNPGHCQGWTGAKDNITFFWNVNIFLVFQSSLLAPRMGRSVKTFQSWRSWTSSRWGRLFGGRSTKIIIILAKPQRSRDECFCQSYC